VASPLDDTECLATLALSRGGVATSGRDHRRWATERGEAHHLIDPRTGRPAETDVLSATVVGSSAARADVAAKVLLIAGSDAGLAWLEREPDLAALIVLEDGATRESSRFGRNLWGAA
jgi:thiamine biosynthesis lipoprotein